MTVMTSTPLMPRGDAWTVDDLARLPEDDGLQYELLDGLLLVSPAPRRRHQVVVAGLFRALDPACPQDLQVLFAPLDWRPDNRTSLQPDVLVCSRQDSGESALTLPLLLAVEVLSPSTRRKDLVLKRSKYEDAGVACFWAVDPDGPSLTAWELRDGRYVEVASAMGDDAVTLERPFPVTITPASLVA